MAMGRRAKSRMSYRQGWPRTPATSPRPSKASNGSSAREVSLMPLRVLLSGPCLIWGCYFLVGPVRLRRYASNQTLIPMEPLAYQDDSIRGDFILADVLAVVAPTHLDDDHHLPQLAVDLHIAEPDDVVGEERD